MRRFSFLIAVFVLCLMVAFAAQAQTTYYVDFQTAQFIPPNERDGSEDKPFLTIGEAMDVAIAGDTVIVKPEHYKENVVVVPGILLRAEHPANDPGTVTDDKTQIEPADDSQPALLIADPGEVVTPEQLTIIDGFQILEGGAEVGSGVLVEDVQVEIRRNEFFFNRAMGSAPFGGGIAVIGATMLADPDEFHAAIIDNLFVGNEAVGVASGRGGALACRPPTGGTGTPVTPRLMIRSNQFIDPVEAFPNRADTGGAVYIEQCEAIFLSNLFRENLALDDGGGLACVDALCNLATEINVPANVFEGNRAVASGGGAALINSREGSDIVDAVFRDNVANELEQGSGNGGGIWVFGDDAAAVTVPIVAMGVTSSDDFALIASNSAVDGGGLAVEGAYGRAVVFDQIIVGNAAERHGGGAYVGPGAMLLLGTERAPDELPESLPTPANLSGARNLLADNLAALSGGGLHAADESIVSVVGNLFGNLVADNGIPEPAEGNRVSLVGDGEGGGAWIDPGAKAFVLLNCFADNESTRGAGLFGGGDEQMFVANSLYQNRAQGADGAAVVLTGALDFAFNEVRENEEGGVTCQQMPAALRDNVIQGNASSNLDAGACGSGDNNATGAIEMMPGFPGATAVFPACGPFFVNSGDYGDAPDDTGGAFVTGYRGDFAGTAGRFPTYLESDHAGAERVGPVHVFPPLFWLGPFTAEGEASVSNDRGAESPLDDDGVPNLDSSTLTAGQDGFKDGWEPRRLEACGEETINIQVSADAMLERFRIDSRTAYFNMAADWNHDGAWGGTEMLCADPAPEWAVQNLEVTLLPGDTVSVPVTVQTGTTGDVWMRVSLSERPLDPPGGDWDGSAPAPGWLFGEVEDYLVCVGDSDLACAAAADQDRLFHDRFEASD